MSVVFQDLPEDYGLAYNDNAFVFRSTNYTSTQRFKVVVLPSTYPVDPALATVRVYPRQATSGSVDRAFYDPSRILQSQVQGQIAIPGVDHAGSFNASDIHYEYALFVQEEDKVNGVYVGGASNTSVVRSVWNGGIKKADWLDFDYEDYDMKSTASSKKFLTAAPNVQYINSEQSAFLYFLSSDKDITRFSVVSYDSAGSVLDSGYMTVNLTDEYGYIACGTYDIENSDAALWTGSTPTTILNGASYYTVQLSGSNAQEKFTFYIDSKCSKYTPIRLHWLNRLGGFDSFNFNLKSMKDEDIKRSSYLQEEHSFTGTRWKYDTASRGTTDYHIGTQDKLTVNTDYLTEAESVWMEDFATSPVIYQEVNNELIAMSGKPKRITEQTSLNDKLMQYTFELDYSLTNSRQRG